MATANTPPRAVPDQSITLPLAAAGVHTPPSLHAPLHHGHEPDHVPPKPQGHVAMLFENPPPGMRVSTRATGTAFHVSAGTGAKAAKGKLWETSFSSGPAGAAAARTGGSPPPHRPPYVAGSVGSAIHYQGADGALQPAAGNPPAAPNAQSADQVIGSSDIKARSDKLTKIVFSQGLTADQFNAFLQKKYRTGAKVSFVGDSKDLVKSQDDLRGARNAVHPDKGGPDVHAGDELDKFMKTISKELYNYQPDGNPEGEKFITIGMVDGHPVVTSLQLLGKMGGKDADPMDSFAIAHTHGALHIAQQPDNGDNDWIHVHNRSSFVIAGENGSNVFEIGRDKGKVSVRTVTSVYEPDAPGAWERYHDDPGDYRHYNPILYPVAGYNTKE